VIEGATQAGSRPSTSCRAELTIMSIAFIATKPLQWRSRPALLGALPFNINWKFKVNSTKKSDEHVCIEDTKE
jgi:hypothetical protein